MMEVEGGGARLGGSLTDDDATIRRSGNTVPKKDRNILELLSRGGE